MYDRNISESFFSIRYIPDQYITHQMCDEALDDCLAALKLMVLLRVKLIKRTFLLLCTQMIIYSILIKFLIMSFFLVM